MKAILFDMDGVLYNSEDPIEGAADALQWVRNQRIPHLFVTNTTSRGRDLLVEKLHRFGIAATPDHILTPCVAAVDRLRTGGKVALFISPKTRSEFASLPLLPDDAETGADHVVIGDLGDGWNFPTLNRAFRLLQSNPDASLVALGGTKFWQAPDGLRLDAGPFVAALEYATGRKPIVYGKPAEPFFHAAARELGLPPEEILMIGDDIEVDVGGAQKAGLRGALVRTGKFRPADLTRGIQPDFILDSVVALTGWWPG
jgi:phospholysine phosphohistidine inorganic pyrophosphate phosphatase